MFTIAISLLVLDWPNLWYSRLVFYVLLVNSCPFYGTGIIILLIQMILEVYGCCILLVWHIVGYIYDLFLAESLVRNTTPNYPPNYNIIPWENLGGWNCWLTAIKRSSSISDKLELNFCFGWQSPALTRWQPSNPIHHGFLCCGFPCWTVPCMQFFYCQDGHLIITVLNDFQIKNNCFVSTWYSNLGSEKPCIQAIRHIQKRLTSPIPQCGIHCLAFPTEYDFAWFS